MAATQPLTRPATHTRLSAAPEPTPRTDCRRNSRGFSIFEVLIAAVIIAVAAMAGVLHLVRRTQTSDWVRDRVFANQRALSILAELRAVVAGSTGTAGALLDNYDDGASYVTTLTIRREDQDTGDLVAPDHPVSGNIQDEGTWRWLRQVSVRGFGEAEANDRRLVTVRVYRRRPWEAVPGVLMAEIASLIQSVTTIPATSQVFDVYALAIENCPGWVLPADQRRSVLITALTDLEARNPGLVFRVHWITKLGYGRDDLYAPYANEERLSTDETPWGYVYPGRLGDDSGDEDDASGGSVVPLDLRYYDAPQLEARINLDGVPLPAFVREYVPAESFVDDNGNGVIDAGEVFTDTNGNGLWDRGNPVPYALADQHNHARRWPEADARFRARVAAGSEEEDAPTWRLLLDRMIADPDAYRNALVLNLHGDVLPMPPARNYSDACKEPDLFPGWRCVTHPERLHAGRVAGNPAASGSPRFRVHAYKTSFENDEVLMRQEEPYVDADGNGIFDPGEPFEDWNANGVWDVGVPLTLVVQGGDLTWDPNGAPAPSLIVRRLAGGIDADGDGAPDPYADWSNAPRYPEPFTDTNGNGRHEVQESWFDLDGDGVKDAVEPHQEMDGNGAWTSATEPLEDQNGNGRFDRGRPAERYTDANGNGRWDAAEPYWDRDGNGTWTAPTAPRTPWVPWDPADYGNATATGLYVAWYGEPFLDLDGDGTWDPAESLVDGNGNGVWDGGFRRGEMWYEVRYEALTDRTVLALHGTPLEAPQTADGRGLAPGARLYDLDYVPCPTPETAAGGNRFERDLFAAGNVPKNTARWTVEMPSAAMGRAFESAPGAFDGDAGDHIVRVETRIGADLHAGTAWPVQSQPGNRSVTYVYCYADASAIPFSERYQFLGDPRHSPYADTDAAGTTFRNGYNWYFDDFRTSGDATAFWPAFDPARLEAGWMGRTADDVPRLLSWLRTALIRTQAVYTALPGFSFRHLSLGGDTGYGVDGPRIATPMDGTPFGLGGTVEDNTFRDQGTAAIRGSVKYLRSNGGAPAGIRAGGYWWSKPWLGELYPDEAYLTQWLPWGNLRATTGGGALTYRQVRRDTITAAQQPTGTLLSGAEHELGYEGCTSFFNSGQKNKTFHHKDDVKAGLVLADGFEVGMNYGFAFANAVAMPYPFEVSTGKDGTVGPEFGFAASYPRNGAGYGVTFYARGAKDNDDRGSALVRHYEPDLSRAGHVVVTAIDQTPVGGPDLVMRYAVLSLVHGFQAEGLSPTASRIVQLPRVELLAPTSVTHLDDPSSVSLEWQLEWARWDGRPYTESYPAGFAEAAADLLYVPIYSRDGGTTWQHVLDDTAAVLGVMPRDGGVPDPLKTLPASAGGGPESCTWPTPAAQMPQGNYRIRIQVFRRGGGQHHAFHEDTVYVDR